MRARRSVGLGQYECVGCGLVRRECEHNMFCRNCARSWKRYQADLKENGIKESAYHGMEWAIARFKRAHQYTAGW